MEAIENQNRAIPTEHEAQALFLKKILEETGDRDLFPEKTARARRLFEGFEKIRQRNIPKASEF